jgi:phage terminase large subunit-like protein
VTATDALSLLAGFRLEDGRRWGDAATSVQMADAVAVLDRTGPRRHWLGRSRGYSKTTDVAGLGLAMLIEQLLPGSLCYAAAADADQAALLVNAVRGFVTRTPGLADAVQVQARRVIAIRTGSVLEVIAADAASAYGLLPALLLIDELCQWKSTANSREFYTALTSALPKVPDARLVVLTTAGDPSHWSRRVYDHAGRSDLWRVSEVPGPAPWQDPQELAEQRATLMPSTYARLFDNTWTASEDRLVDPADLDAAMVLRGDQPGRPGVRYVVGVDLGLKNDATVFAVAHRERLSGDAFTFRVVVDRLRRWRGSRDQPLQVGDVEEALVALRREYPQLVAVVDPWQAMGLIQRLNARGVRAIERPFTTQSVGRLAHGLYSLLKSRRIHLPEDETLRSELLGVRLRETHPGQYRMDHDAGAHDDQAIAIALAAAELLMTPVSPGAAFLDQLMMSQNAPDEPRLMTREGHW